MSGHGEVSGLVRAMDVEVRVLAEEGKPPAWTSHPDEAGHWIYEVAQRVLREAIDGVVQVDRHYVEPHSFTQFMSVFVAPSSSHRHAIQGGLGEIVSRLQHDLSVKFGIERTPPVVRIEPDRHFLEDAGGAVAVLHPEVEPRQPGGQPFIVVQQPPQAANDSGQASGSQQGRTQRGALLWTGGLLGASLIANIFLLVQANDLRGQVVSAADMRVEMTKLTMDNALIRTARSFESAQCNQSITQHREMISDLAKRCSPRDPAPKPPPLPQPYPASPDPFAQP
jgi:hypothetical protein